MATIIAFGTQPDQVEAGMGGTILKLTELTHQVTIIDLTNGELFKNQQSDHRKREAIKASRILGIDERITLDYLYPELENNREISTSPDIIFIPYPVDTNPESRITAEICSTSFSQLYQQNTAYTKKKIFYYFAAPFTYYQKPSFVMDISKEIEMKVEALKCYESQFGQNLQNSQLFESTLNLSRYYGMLIGTKFGESFTCKEPLEIKNIELMI